MRQDNRVCKSGKSDIRKEKVESKKRYAQRQIDKWVKWSITQRGKVPYKELMDRIDFFNNIKK